MYGCNLYPVTQKRKKALGNGGRPCMRSEALREDVADWFDLDADWLTPKRLCDFPGADAQ